MDDERDQCDQRRGRDFHHPFQPYDVQQQFMDAVYDCLDAGKVGIFESPTGTGKSLSLICGSLTWLRDYKRAAFDSGLGSEEAHSDEPAWLIEHARKQRRQAASQRKQEFDARIAKIKAREAQERRDAHNGPVRHKRQKFAHASADAIYDSEAQFALDDYDSDAERDAGPGRVGFDDSGLSAETRALMERVGKLVQKPEADDETLDETKIFFCSRTHSQLTQFSGELRRVKMPPAIMAEPSQEPGADPLIEDVKLMTLGSRKNLCINPKVNKSHSATAINERCLELQKGTLGDCKCEFLPNAETKPLVNSFRDHALARVRDIEDLASLGKSLGICPYYASRSAVKYCEVLDVSLIVTLPYPLLLQKAARDALDLSLKGHVVVIDEAHNLMDAITSIYSVMISLQQLQQARGQLAVYLRKFRNKLKGKNRTYVAQTLRMIDSLASFLSSKDTNPGIVDGEVTIGTLMSGKGMDQINTFKLNTYLQESHLARKVDGYTQWTEQVQQKPAAAVTGDIVKPGVRQSVPVLTIVQSFLVSLMNPSVEGRFLFLRDEAQGMALRYMLLDPTHHFREIVEDARAVILAGGTMSPMSDYEQHLLSYLPAAKLMTLSCGHVIPSSNLIAIPIIQNEDRQDFELTFELRNAERKILDIGVAIWTIVRNIPDGVVIFFPSYSYLDQCISVWKNHRAAISPAMSMWSALQNEKPIFLEQRSKMKTDTPDTANKESAVNSVLKDYSTAIATGEGRGALLLAVIGGTLSEGINFSDSLGRGVVIVGLPFPNPHTAEWKAKLAYISSKAHSTSGQNGQAAAREFYENACMRAVNQCVGRAIRHRDDYAAIMLLDSRYGGERIQNKLPAWIHKSLTPGVRVSQLSRQLTNFFKDKKRESHSQGSRIEVSKS